MTGGRTRAGSAALPPFRGAAEILAALFAARQKPAFVS